MDLSSEHIRPIAICVFGNGNKILVAEGFDSVRNISYYRPIGGGIKFGEMSRDALVREIREELAAEITDLRYLGTIEDIFTMNSIQRHQIIQIYDAQFCDSSLYERAFLEGTEDKGSTYRAVWKDLSEFGLCRARLVPEGLLELLTQGS